MNKKLQKLKKSLAGMKSVLIAYSGGVDSTFLLKVAKDALGDKAVAVTAVSLTYPLREIEDAKKIARKLGIRHLIIKTDELSNPEFFKNTVDRCYWCKKELFSRLAAIAGKLNLNYVLDGSNYDDIKDFRPGMKAAREFNVGSPLKEAGFTKEDIRSFSKKLGLPTWNKPSFACLSSRFPYGTRITRENLLRVNKAERFLKDAGIGQVRVRHHNGIARIEVSRSDMSKLFQERLRDKALAYFKRLGYSYVTVDLEGYRTGSMNEILKGDNGR